MSLLTTNWKTTTAEKVSNAIKSGANVNERGEMGVSNLTNAVHHGASLDVIRELINAGANVNGQDIYGFAPLHANGDAIVIQTLIDAGADVNIRSLWKSTPLHSLCWYCNNLKLDSFQTLIDAGADVNAREKHNRTVLHNAVDAARNNKYIDLIQMLLNNGADVKLHDDKGKTACDMALEKYFIDINVHRQMKEILENATFNTNTKN